MKFRSIASGLIALLLLIGITACDDPSGVGLGLVDEEGGEPRSASQALELQSVREAPVTGSSNNVLVGQAIDPVLNHSVTAHGFVGFTSPTEEDIEELEGEEIQAVTFRFSPAVHYGDTTGTVDVALRSIVDEWEGLGLTADTTLEADEVIDEYSLSLGEPTAQFELPDTWVREHEEALRDTALASQFFGFQLETLSGDAIASFQVSTATLVIRTTGNENVTLGGTRERTLTNIESTEPEVTDRLLLQHGTGHGAQVNIPLADTLANSTVNRVVLELPVDTVSLQQAAFQRPDIGNIFVELSTPTDNTVIQLTPDARKEGIYSSEDDVVNLRQFMQQTVVQGSLTENLTIRVLPESHYASLFPDGVPPDAFPLNMSTVLLYTGATDCPYDLCTPRLLLTTTPIE